MKKNVGTALTELRDQLTRMHAAVNKEQSAQNQKNNNAVFQQMQAEVDKLEKMFRAQVQNLKGESPDKPSEISKVISEFSKSWLNLSEFNKSWLN